MNGAANVAIVVATKILGWRFAAIQAMLPAAGIARPSPRNPSPNSSPLANTHSLYQNP